MLYFGYFSRKFLLKKVNDVRIFFVKMRVARAIITQIIAIIILFLANSSIFNRNPFPLIKFLQFCFIFKDEYFIYAFFKKLKSFLRFNATQILTKTSYTFQVGGFSFLRKLTPLKHPLNSWVINNLINLNRVSQTP